MVLKNFDKIRSLRLVGEKQLQIKSKSRTHRDDVSGDGLPCNTESELVRFYYQH